MLKSRRGTLLASGWLLIACVGGPAPLEHPDERQAGSPLATSRYPRSGEITYQLNDLEPGGDVLRIQFTLHNGTSRHLANSLLRVVLHGAAGELASARYPTGALRPGQSRPLTALLEPPAFAVRHVDLELIWTMQ